MSEFVVTRADEALVDFAAIGAASGTAWGGLWVRSSACSVSLYPSRGERHAIQVVQPVYESVPLERSRPHWVEHDTSESPGRASSRLAWGHPAVAPVMKPTHANRRLCRRAELVPSPLTSLVAAAFP